MEKEEFQPIVVTEGKCGYYDERDTLSQITTIDLMKVAAYKDAGIELTDCQVFNILMESGFRRSGNYLYKEMCESCSECTPIRLRPDSFEISKSQRKVWNKNQDIEVTITGILSGGKNPGNEAFATEEKAFMFREYDAHHNGDRANYHKMTIEEAVEHLEYMNSGYEGVLNMEYRLDGKLIAVGVLDYGMDLKNHINSISSNYFYYDVSDEVLKRSIGVFSVLKEIELCRKFNIPNYYLGLYLPNCRKMNYKIKYKPYELLENGKWTEHQE